MTDKPLRLARTTLALAIGAIVFGLFAIGASSSPRAADDGYAIVAVATR